MRFSAYAMLCGLFLFAWAAPGICQPEASPDSLSKEKVIAQLESRYGGADIQAEFVQESTLEAMDITDTATGRVWFKHPGMMRWEYETPDQHAIITDGETLWIHRPSDNQVIVGDALTYFGNGKGASFLSNIKLIKEEFTVEKVAARTPGYLTLKLIPRQKELEISEIFLNIDPETFIVASVATQNAYGDETRINFKNIRFKGQISAEKFRFEIPEGADVVQFEQ
jgi:outer membrane lipoprotein carrier protein